MEFRGHIKDGKVLVEEPVNLPNGTEVRVVARPRAKRARSTSRAGRRIKAFAEHYAGVIGAAPGFPRDAARNVDHYLYGASKRP